jgi:peptidyl-dipeptidase Dcp
VKRFFLMMLAGSLIFTSCTKKADVNPLLAKYDTPFEVPPFEKVELKHFVPAFDSAMVLHKAEIEAILTNTEEPTFKNTIEASFYAGELLSKVGTVFGTFNSVNISDSIQILAQEIYPKLSAHGDEIGLDPRFWERVKVVYANKEKFNLNAEQSFLLESVYKGFIRSGADLPEDKKEELKKINQELSSLTLQFEQNVLGEVNQYKLIIDNEKDLAGLPESSIQAAAETAMNDSLVGKWVFTLAKT